MRLGSNCNWIIICVNFLKRVRNVKEKNKKKWKAWRNCTSFFFKQHFYKQRQVKFGKNSSKCWATLWNFVIWKSFTFFVDIIIQMNGNILKINKRTHESDIHEIVWLIMRKMKTKAKNRSHRFDINKPRSRHWNKYRTHKKGLTMMMLIWIKQHLSKSWSLIHWKS